MRGLSAERIQRNKTKLYASLVKDSQNSFWLNLYEKAYGYPLNQEKRREKILNKTLKSLRRTEQSNQHSILLSEEQDAAKERISGRNILYWLVDDTKNGGPHDILALYDRESKTLFIERTDDPAPVVNSKGQKFSRRNGCFVSNLHAIEVDNNVEKKAMNCDAKVKDNALQSETSWQIIPKRGPASVQEKIRKIDPNELAIVFIPLTYQPGTSYKITLHPNAGKSGDFLNGYSLAHAYKSYVNQDEGGVKAGLRHIFIVQGRVYEACSPTLFSIEIIETLGQTDKLFKLPRLEMDEVGEPPYLVQSEIESPTRRQIFNFKSKPHIGNGRGNQHAA